MNLEDKTLEEKKDESCVIEKTMANFIDRNSGDYSYGIPIWYVNGKHPKATRERGTSVYFGNYSALSE